MDRRSLMRLSVPMMASAAVLDLSLAGLAKAAAEDAKPPGADYPPTPLFPTDLEFWFSTLVILGSSDYGTAEPGEVIAVAKRIKPHDYESWYEGWNWFADKVSAEADRDLAKKHYISARDGYVRAANYYRASEHWLHATPHDPRVTRAYKRTVACYTAAGALFKPAITPVEIPYEGKTLPGYMSFPRPLRKGRPTIIMHTGFDGAAEDMHGMGFAAARERDYNVLVFDGPGQFGAIHRDGLPFRYDWEHVIGPVMDFVLKQPGVDPNRLALMGVSLGGYLAPRAAVFDKRIKALICNDGVYDFAERFTDIAPPAEREAFIAGIKAEQSPAADAILERAMAGSSQVRWFMTHGIYSFGVKTPREFVRKALDFNLRNGLAERITCPTAVCNPTADTFFRGQQNPSEILYSHLTCPKVLLKFTAEEGAGDHCQSGTNRLGYGRIFNWLDETFA